jgi:hypothetical protein
LRFWWLISGKPEISGGLALRDAMPALRFGMAPQHEGGQGPLSAKHRFN